MKTCARLISLMLLLVLAVSLIPYGNTQVSALTPSYNVGPMYKESAYYRRLLEVELTGDHRYDFISVAISQLGYHEGNSELDMDGMNIDGSKNFVEYNRVYGKVDNNEGNGVSYGYEWCAAFVSWCLRQAGIPKDVATTEISCNRMTNWYKKNDNNTFFMKNVYTPLAGDIIMFADEDSPSHVGLVLGMKDGYVYTIEGNSGGKVGIHSYKQTSDYIYGYCVPKYTSVEGVDCAALLEENINMTGKYIASRTLNVRAEATTQSEVIAKLKDGDAVDVTEISGDWGKISIDGAEGWIYTPYAVHERYMVYSIKFNAKGGENGLQYQRKLLGEKLIISKITPTRNGYQFMGWDTDKGGKNVVYEVGDEYTADKDTTLYAVWTPMTYTVTFYNDDGSIIEKRNYNYQDLLEEPQTPQKESDGEYSYVFAGWDRELADVVVKNLAYTATYTKEPLPPEEEGSAMIKLSPVVIIAIAGISVAVLAVVVIITLAVIIKKKKKKQ